MFYGLLWLHATAGGIALLGGPVAMLVRKGGPVHRRAGRVYAVAMVTTAVSAVLLAVLTRNRLLLTVGVFSFFLVFKGWRAPALRRGPARWFDRA